MELGIKPAGYRLLVKPDEVDEKSAGGIILNIDKRLEEAGQTLGTLIAIGDQAWQDVGIGEAWAEVGDRVMYARYAGHNLPDPLSGEMYLVLNDQDVTAVITGEKE